MRQRGVMTFDTNDQTWKIQIGRQIYETINGMFLEVRIKNHYYEAYFEKDYNECIITIEDDIIFTLRLAEDYPIRISERELIPEFDLPF
jgi:hypothetical protein